MSNYLIYPKAVASNQRNAILLSFGFKMFLQHNLHTDVPKIDIHFIDEPDPHFNVLGAMGIGEIGNAGASAAIANAIYHATGKRIRDLAITPEKLL